MTRHTPLHDAHLARNAKMVDFFGWEMPLHYGSQIQEHHAVRQNAGVFDVSHMGIIDVQGDEAEQFLSSLLANNIQRVSDGQALYTCLLNHQAGILDDLIAYRLSHNRFRLIVNASTTEKDWSWMQEHVSRFQCTLNRLTHCALLALQGPRSSSILPSLFDDESIQHRVRELKPFHVMETSLKWMIARTGYTGEHGYEIILPHTDAVSLFNRLIDAGVSVCGLGARDTLRLEAGLNLYGSDMDESISPDECNLSWTVSLDPESRDFIGKSALLERRNSPHKKLFGLLLQDKGVLRSHQTVWQHDKQIGKLTSGGFSPTLNRSIGFARIDCHPIQHNDLCWVDIRGKKSSAVMMKLPFVRHGKSCLTTD